MKSDIALRLFSVAYALLTPLVLGLFAAWLTLHGSAPSLLKDWQTLFAGGLAVGAAVLGGLFVFHQTSEVRRRAEAVDARKHASARSVLPLALSDVVEHADTVAKLLEGLRGTAVGQRILGDVAIPFNPPELDEAVFRRLQAVIEDATDEVADRIAILISDIQVLTARLRSVRRTLSPGSTSIFVMFNLDDYIINSAVLFARASALFEYGRRESNQVPTPFPTEQELVSALNLMGFDEDVQKDVYRFARARAVRKNSASK